MNRKICMLIAFALCIGLLLTGFSAGQLEKSVTLSYSGVVQQTSTSSPLNAIWIQEVIGDYLNQNQQAIVQNLLDSNIKYVFVQVGNWLQYTNDSVARIVYWYNSSILQSAINSIHTYSNNQIRVLAWFYCSVIGGESFGGPVNLEDSTIRQECVNAAVACTQTYGFDGINDDLIEGYIGTDANYVVFVNALGTALSGINKISSCDLESPWSDANYTALYGGITNVNYICTMLYGGPEDGSWAQEGITANLNQALTYSNVQVLAGVYVNPYPNNITLADILGWIGHPSNSKFSGVCMFDLAYMQSSDWPPLYDWVAGS